RLEACRRRLSEDWRAENRANRAYEAYRARGVMRDGRPFGSPPKPYSPPEAPEGKLNTTDPDARRMKSGRSFIPAYNAQAVTNEHQIVIAAEISADTADFGHLEPMVSAAQDELKGAGVCDTPAVVVADAGYWHQDQMETVVGRGIQVLIPPDALKRKGARPGWDGGAYAFMRRVLDTDHGGDLYRKRQGMIEPVFADTKFNRRIDRFQRRGRSACRSEWRLITATHNLMKLFRHQMVPAAA
nr:transposase [Actinomycetota bacterium]